MRQILMHIDEYETPQAPPCYDLRFNACFGHIQ